MSFFVLFIVQHTIITDDIALARFSCHLTACKGACCVVGDAGAPITQNEVPALRKAYELLSDELPESARLTVSEKGLIQQNRNDSSLELACVDGKECVFVKYDENDVALCAIQKAYHEGRTNWIKPISCHLFPIRISTIGAVDYLNFEFVPEICTPAVEHAKSNKLFLAESLEEPLTRKYGKEWYSEFLDACAFIREKAGIK